MAKSILVSMGHISELVPNNFDLLYTYSKMIFQVLHLRVK